MTSAGRPALSVVVRSIGRTTLDRALASIAAHRHPPAEIVLVAASGRDHALIPNRFGPCPIVAVPSAIRLPRAAAADAGLRAATGEWITFLDDDDEFLPDHLDGLIASATAAPEVRAVTGRALATFQSGRTEVWGQRFALAELYERNFVHLSTLLFHRSLRDKGIAFDRTLPLHEDWDFALQVAQHTRFADWPEPTFRWHADAGSSGGGGESNVDEATFARYRDQIYAKWATVRDEWVERCATALRRATAHAAAGRLAEAAADARAVLTFSQNDPHALNLLAMLAMRNGDSAEALACQSLAAEVRPHDADIRFNLAQVHLARGDRERARATLAEVLALRPTHAGAAAGLRLLATPVSTKTPGSRRAEPPAQTPTTPPIGSHARFEQQDQPMSPAAREEFLDLERGCAKDPADLGTWRRMLQRFIAIGCPDDLPGASLPLPPGTREPRIAVLTPYLREPLATLERCHRSVRRQTVHCEHILVANGFARDEVDAWPVRHLRLSTSSANYGDTPRRIAGEAVTNAGFDAVVYLDADNWLRPRHVESLFACHLAYAAAVCHSARTFHRPDGSIMPLVLGGDNVDHVDTSCLFVAPGAFDLITIWGTWPRELSSIDDRIFWQAARSRHTIAFSGALTSCYEASHFSFYRTLGEAPPAGTRPDIDLTAVFAWHARLSDLEREALDLRWGFSVSALLESLRLSRR